MFALLNSTHVSFTEPTIGKLNFSTMFRECEWGQREMFPDPANEGFSILACEKKVSLHLISTKGGGKATRVMKHPTDEQFTSN